jgi:DNA-binding transcriptional ArsR family regulator
MTTGASLASTFVALSDSTRRSILERLRQGPASVSELAAPYSMSLNAVSKHLKVLEKAGLLKRTRHGRQHELRLDAAPLRQVALWVHAYESYWNQHLDQLQELLKKRRKGI